jgi:hypothetical protein
MNVGRLSRLILSGAVLALLAVPIAQAARGDLVQIDGKLVAPAQISETQLAAGHASSTSLMQIGGDLIEPLQSSIWQSRAGGPIEDRTVNDNSSSAVSTATIAAAAALGGLVLLGSSTFVLRRKRGLAPA